MAQVTGIYTRYNSDGSIDKTEVYSIDIEPDDRVRFVDNSIMDQCRNNDDGADIDWMYAGCSGNNYNTYYGTVSRTDSCQTAEGPHVVSPYTRIVEMPIVVITDDGDVVYCNPLNIQKA